MITDNFLLKKPFPGSSTCILIGRTLEGMELPAEFCRAVLWVVDAAGSAHPPTGSVSVLPVDRCAPEQLEKAIDEFLVNSPKSMPSLYVTRQIPLEHESQFGTAIEIVVACVESHHRTRVTRQQDAFAWQSSLFENTPAYLTRRLPDSWQGSFAGIPAFVCGAGPSLDVSARELAKVAHQGLVLAADSSLSALSKLGVQADFAVSVDIAKTPLKCLPERLAPGRLILSATSPPQWSDAVPNSQLFYVSSNQLTLDWFAAQGVSRTKVSVCENCGATAIELARFLGCYPICLFGMDMALNSVGPMRRHHESVDATIYKNSGFNPQQEFPRVPGNFSPEVPTHAIGDWRALDRRIAEWPEGLVWVVTDRGARLRNTTILRPEEFSLPAVELRKQQRLTALAGPLSLPEETVYSVLDKLNRFGGYLAEWAPTLRRTLNTGGAKLLVEKLRTLFALSENGQMLGAYSLKLMPHLLPPVSEDVAFWGVIIDELENLGRHAMHAAAKPQS